MMVKNAVFYQYNVSPQHIKASGKIHLNSLKPAIAEETGKTLHPD